MEKWKTLQNVWKSKPFSGRFPLSHRLYDNDEKHLLPIKNVSTFNQDLTKIQDTGLLLSRVESGTAYSRNARRRVTGDGLQGVGAGLNGQYDVRCSRVCCPDRRPSRLEALKESVVKLK